MLSKRADTDTARKFAMNLTTLPNRMLIGAGTNLPEIIGHLNQGASIFLRIEKKRKIHLAWTQLQPCIAKKSVARFRDVHVQVNKHRL